MLLKTDCICYLCSNLLQEALSTCYATHCCWQGTMSLADITSKSCHIVQEWRRSCCHPLQPLHVCWYICLSPSSGSACIASSASVNMVLCAACSSKYSSLALWLASPLLFQMRLEVLALGFLKTVSGFERKWFGVFKSSCVPSSQLDSQISLSRDYRCHVNVFISDVFSQCLRGLNLLLSTLWSQSCCLLNISGISWKERKHWTGTTWCWTVFLI